MGVSSVEEYLGRLNGNRRDLDRVVEELVLDRRQMDALRTRVDFLFEGTGNVVVDVYDNGKRPTQVRRAGERGNYLYEVLGENGEWSRLENEIWVLAMRKYFEDYRPRVDIRS